MTRAATIQANRARRKRRHYAERIGRRWNRYFRNLGRHDRTCAYCLHERGQKNLNWWRQQPTAAANAADTLADLRALATTLRETPSQNFVLVCRHKADLARRYWI